MITIYGIFVSGVCYYIGQTGNIERRLREHRKAIENGTHSVKALNALNKVDIEQIEMRAIAELSCDSSLLVCMVEGLYNSLYKPKNRIAWRSGGCTVTYSRVEKDVAVRLLDEMIELGVVRECTKMDIRHTA